MSTVIRHLIQQSQRCTYRQLGEEIACARRRLARLLALHRHRRGLSLPELAAESGVRLGTINRAEAGLLVPASDLKAILHALEMAE